MRHRAPHGVGVAREKKAAIAQDLTEAVGSNESRQELDDPRLNLRVQREETRLG